MAATHLTGVKVSLVPRLRLQKLYKRILQLIYKFPEDSAYRQNTEEIICHRLSIVNETEDIQDIENKINCGRIEMLISQAYDEYKLCLAMKHWKTWEPLIQKPPPNQWKWPPVLK